MEQLDFFAGTSPDVVFADLRRLARRSGRGSWWSVRRGTVQSPGSAPPFAAGRAAMSLHRRGIDENRSGRSPGRGQGVEDVNPDALRSPSYEPVVERLVRPVGVGRILPPAPRLQHVDDPADDPPVVDPRLAPSVGRQQRREAVELSLGQPKVLSVHGDLHSEIVESEPG